MRPFTEEETANNNFFGNSVSIDMQLDELRVFLDEVNSFIKITNVHLQADRIKGLDSDTSENLKYHFEHTQGTILRKSILISLVIILEAEISTFCEDFKVHKKLQVSFKDFRGDILDKFKLYVNKILILPFNFQGTPWQDIIGLYEIRNSLIHNCGSITNFGKRQAILNFINRNGSFEIGEYDEIIVSQQACLNSIQLVEKFFDEITRLALEVFPKSYRLDDDDLDVPF